MTKSVASAIANASRASASAAWISARRASTRARTRRQRTCVIRSPLARQLGAELSKVLGLLVASLFEDHHGEGRGHRRAERALAHLLERAIRRARAPLGRSRVPGEQLDDGLVLGGRHVEREAEVGVGGVARRDQLAGKREAADNRVEACELAEDRCLGLGAFAHLRAHRLATADALGGRGRPEPERGRDPRENLVVLMPIPCPPRVGGRALPRRGGRLAAGLVKK